MSEQDIDPGAIAIVGMAAHLPGARSVAEYWANLVGGIEAVELYSDEELLAAGVPAATLRHPRYVKSGCPLPDMPMFDGEFFGFSPKESAILDPQHRHFLEVAWEALEDAGHPPSKFDGPIGVYGGCGMGSYLYFNLCSNPDLVESVGLFLLRHTGNDKDFLTTRVSHVLDLTGPSVNVQTACSTSLVAVHSAIQSLTSFEIDMALAGGVTIQQPHRQGYFYEEGEVLSPDGHCHAFDHRSQGTVFGSGAGVVALRRLADAIEDHDHIYAVIKSTAINNDGAGKANYLAPSVTGQASCIVEALTLGDIDPESVGYIECHGTGTFLGDPIEVAALTTAFRETTDKTGFCRIGSVKTNIGHLDTAAGVASLIKAARIVEEGVIPPTLNFEKPNPTIDFDASPFVVADELIEWPGRAEGDKPRRAGIQSLGVGGTNAHVIIEEPPVVSSTPSAHPHHLLRFSARTKGALVGASERFAAYFRGEPADIADVAYTLAEGRHDFDRRRVIVATDVHNAADILETNDRFRVHDHSVLSDPSVVFLFPGGGSQYVGMGKDLYETNATFKRVMDEGFALLKELEVDYDLKSLIFAEGAQQEAAARTLKQPYVQLPAVFLVSYAMAITLEERGVVADAMLGHSLGEYVAACLAGVFSFEEALGLVLVRGELILDVPEGAMVAIPLSEEKLLPYIHELGDEVDLAIINGPLSTVASGPTEAVDALEKRLLEDEIETRRLAIDRAGHSRMFAEVAEHLFEYIEGMTLKAPTRKFVSCHTGTWIQDTEATSSRYWADHLRHTVRFGDALLTLAQREERVMLEVGPGKSLSSFAKQTPGIDNQAVIATLRHQNEDVRDDVFLLEVFGRLWAVGHEIDLGFLFEGETRKRVGLPTYAFQKHEYYIKRVEAATASSELEKLEDIRDWAYVPTWVPRAAEPELYAQDTDARETVLVFMDDAGIGSRAVEQLRKAGHTCVCVFPGDKFVRRNEKEFVLSPERGREHYDQLLQALLAQETLPTRILHLWLVTGDRSFRPGSSFFHRNQERGFYSLLFLAQALADEGVPGPIHLQVVSTGALRVEGLADDDTLTDPEKATALGPVQVMGRELSDVTASLLDIRLPGSGALFGGRLRMALVDPFAGRKAASAGLDTVAAAVVDELLTVVGGHRVAALRGSKRFERDYQKAQLAPARSVPVLRKGGAYLITGGLGGLGLVAAGELARAGEATLVLLSRTGLPERDQWDAHLAEHGAADATSRRITRVRELEAGGSTVLAVAADVTNLEEMRDLKKRVNADVGPIRGVVHTAGVVMDGLLQAKSLSSIAEVFAAKIHGTLVLDTLYGDDENCEFMVLYSSTSTAIAPAGQVDYVAANAFLDAYAQSRVGQTPKTTALHWGIWNAVGMAAEAFQQADLSAAPDTLPATSSPLFDGRVRDTHGQLHLQGTLSPAQQWLLEEHRINARAGQERGPALIPGTGYFEYAAEALAELGETAPFEVRDLFFLRPLHVADNETRDVRVKMRRSSEGYGMEVRSACVVDGKRAWQLHAQATLALGATVSGTEMAVDLADIESRCPTVSRAAEGERLDSAQEVHLEFGSRWKVLVETRLGEGEAIAHLALLDEHRSDLESTEDSRGYLMHPALLDISTGYAMQLIEGYEAKNLWVPVSYDSVVVLGTLPAQVRSWVRLHGDADASGQSATFDITITDLEGKVLVDIRKFTVHRLGATQDVTQVAPPTRAEVDFDGMVQGEERTLSPGERRLQRNLERGILPHEGADVLRRVLATPESFARPEIFASSLDLKGLIKQAGEVIAESSAGATFARPELDSEFVEARDDIERALVGFWQELLGLEQVGVQDSFFDLGGHSLIAVRLFAMVKKTFAVEFPISVLFEAPTIEQCAALIREAGGASESTDLAGDVKKPRAAKRRFAHLVAMHPSGNDDATPFFLVAGMFGNVLNLRHLAHLIGTDRPFYGVQAKGLYGDEKPHETFEEMAQAYLKEIRSVQKTGPYLLGGFSGGGYTALEMARVLREEGEEVPLLVMLDTPAALNPEKLTLRDRASIQTQRFEKQGAGYLVKWAKDRFEWEMGKLRRRFEEPETLGQSEFHNDAIEAAFRRALGRYKIPKWDKAVLFRPPLEESYVLPSGQALDSDREYVYKDNGWGHFIDEIEVHVVPGDHDSMVLEPNVRVMARKLRQLIDNAVESGAPKSPKPPSVQRNIMSGAAE